MLNARKGGWAEYGFEWDIEFMTPIGPPYVYIRSNAQVPKTISVGSASQRALQKPGVEYISLSFVQVYHEVEMQMCKVGSRQDRFEMTEGVILSLKDERVQTRFRRDGDPPERRKRAYQQYQD
ncbi:hypothetical protein KJ359_005083 [Pestalotiopsis sp. 9143b]|nr:hypothetical protein KJ359_005083 [Pestalotiopsis sp. 9143b]